MKLVSLVITAMIISFGASAQTTSNKTEKNTAAQTQQKAKKQKAKLSKTNVPAKDAGVTTLSEEKAHKAKWTFEQMLARRLEIDAAEGERKRQQQKE